MKFDFSAVIGNMEPAVATTDSSTAIAAVGITPAVEKEIVNSNEKTVNVTPIEEAKKQMTQKATEIKKAQIDASQEVVRLSSLMKDIKSYLNSKFLERENEIDMLSVAFVSATNAFLHGKPGTGKSDLVETFSNCFNGSNYFRILMSKTTEPSEVFGPVSINSLKNDKYKVITDNKLPQAHFGFLDEIFKANSAVLNGMLTIMNERLFFNDTVEEVPLVSIIGASNEFPEEDSLEALYDRFLLRWDVKAISDVNNREKLFKNFINSRNSKSIVNTNKQVAATSTTPSMSYKDLNMMIELAKSVTFDDSVILEYNKLFSTLEKEGIVVSDRRKNEAIKAIQANAVLNGRLQAELEDFLPLTYCFWDDVEDIPVIKSIVQKLSNPDADFIEEYTQSLKDSMNIIKEFVEQHKDDPDYDVTKAVRLTEMRSSVNYALDKIADKRDSVTSDVTKAKLDALTLGFKDFLDELKAILVGEEQE